MISPIIKNFETPDEIREFEKGRFELVELPNMTIGKATYDQAGNGAGMFHRWHIQNSAKLSTWGWSYQEAPRLFSRMALYTQLKKGMYSMCPGTP